MFSRKTFSQACPNNPVHSHPRALLTCSADAFWGVWGAGWDGPGTHGSLRAGSVRMLGLRSPGTKAESSKGALAPPAPGSHRAGCVRSWRGAGPQCSPAGPGAPLAGGAGAGETAPEGMPRPPRKDADAGLPPTA